MYRRRRPKISDPTQGNRAIKTVWFGITFSLIPLLVVQYVTAQENGDINVEPVLDLNNPLTQMAAGLAVMSFIIPKIIFKSSFSKFSSQPKISFTDFYSSGFVPFIVQMVLIEQIALIGFVKALMEHNFGAFLPFVTASALLFVFAFPSLEKMKNLLRLQLPNIQFDGF